MRRDNWAHRRQLQIGQGSDQSLGSESLEGTANRSLLPDRGGKAEEELDDVAPLVGFIGGQGAQSEIGYDRSLPAHMHRRRAKRAMTHGVIVQESDL